MQSRHPEVNVNSFGGARPAEVTEYTQKMATDSHINNISTEIGSLNGVPKSAEASFQFKNGNDGMPSISSDSSTNSDSLSQPVSTHKDTVQKELGLIDDLVKLGLPKDHMNTGSQQNLNNSYPIQSNIVQDNSLGFSVANTDSDIFDVNTSYSSDSTGLRQTTDQNNLQPNGAIESVNSEANGIHPKHLRNKLPEDATSLHKDLSTKSKKSLKNDKKGKQKTVNNEQNMDRSLFSTSPLTQHEYSDGRHSSNVQAGQRHQTSTKPGSPKFIRPNSKPGVLSDDEYIINVSSTVNHHGRRSAPIFTKRGFSASEFWNSGQTAIERTHLQDVANFRVQDRQKVKSPTAHISVTFPDKSYSLSHKLRRPHSTVPSNFVHKIKNSNSKVEPVQSGNASQNGGKSFFVNYGSTDDTARRVDSRGYHSELDVKDWRLRDASFFPSRQRLSGNDGNQPYDQLSWNIEDGASSGMGNDTSMLESSEKARTHGMRGVFRTPRIISPLNPDVMITRGKDVVKMSKTGYSYIPEDKTAISLRESSGSSSDDSSVEGKDDKKVPLKVKSVESSEDDLDIKTETRTEVYKRRWYLLFLFSITAMLWNAIWSTWGPIAQSAKDVYNWDDGDIAMFTYLGNIPFLITMFPCAYLMDVSGMRTAMIFCCGFMFVGAGFRCIPGDTSTSTWLIRAGQWLNGMAGTIPSSGPALLSGLWFPPNQRATATAISTVAGYMGASISFVIGPLLVPEPSDLSPVNGTSSFLSDDFDSNTSSNASISYYAQEQGIKTILYTECGLAGVLLLLVILYFPSKPPLPPSISASIPREKYLNGLKMLVRNKQFWICAIAFSVPIGVYESWQVILDINLDSKGISQQTAGWLDFYATVGGCVSGLLVSRFADIFIRQMKLFLLVFYTFATVAILWLTLVVLDIIPFDQVSIFAAIIITGIFLDGGSPLFFELTIEVSYPVGEGVTSGFMHMLCAAAGTAFLLLVEIKDIGTEWMNWCFLGCVALTIPLMLFINTTYARADIDDMEIDVSDDEEATTGIEAADTNEKTSLLKNSTV